MLKPRALVLGATGTVGKILCDRLQSENADVLRPTRAQFNFTESQEITDYLARTQPSLIFHLVGISPTSSLEKLTATFADSTRNLLEAVSQTVAQATVIVPGSAAEYGDSAQSTAAVDETCPTAPVNAYGEAKLRQTTTAVDYAHKGLNVIVGRIFNVLSAEAPQESAVGLFLHQLKQAKISTVPAIITTRSLNGVRDYLDVSDVAAALMALSKSGKPGEIYNICSGRGVKMRMLLELMIRQSGVQVAINETHPSPFTEVDVSIGSNKKICSQTAWMPKVSLAEAVAKLF